MQNAQKPDHISLTTLMQRLREGRFMVPNFQRAFEWEPWDISNLMRSIFLDYYIGSLLLWNGSEENFKALSCTPLFGHAGGGKPEYIVLDGQQRLTAMHYAFMAPAESFPRRKKQALYFIRVDKLMQGDHDEAFIYEWRTRHIDALMEDRKAQFDKHLFPLSIIGKEDQFILYQWMQDYEAYWRGKRDAEEHAANARLFRDQVLATYQQYQVSYIELARQLPVDKVCDIFTQINSRGVRLNVFDLMNAMLTPEGLELKNMWLEAESRLSWVENTRKMNVYILQVMSVLSQRYCSPKYLYYLLPGRARPVRREGRAVTKEVLIHSADEFEALWQRAVDALERAIKTLRHPQEYGAVSPKYLPYVAILPAFASLQELVKELPPNRQLAGRRKIRRWYWASVFTTRYSGSVESTTARDYLDIKAWLDDDDAVPSMVRELEQRFRNLDLKREVRRGSATYNGIFNLHAVVMGRAIARVLASLSRAPRGPPTA